MTKQEAAEEAIRVYALVRSWRRPTPYGRAVFGRWKELMDWCDGTGAEPDPAWTEESIAGLEGGPGGKGRLRPHSGSQWRG